MKVRVFGYNGPSPLATPPVRNLFRYTHIAVLASSAILHAIGNDGVWFVIDKFEFVSYVWGWDSNKKKRYFSMYESMCMCTHRLTYLSVEPMRLKFFFFFYYIFLLLCFIFANTIQTCIKHITCILRANEWLYNGAIVKPLDTTATATIELWTRRKIFYRYTHKTI